jgi:hypothetical protein
MVFGRLTVVSRAENKGDDVRWACRCSCGNEAVVATRELRKGDTRSCGCLNLEVMRSRGTHRMKGTPEHNSWANMIRRCEDPTNTDYGGYGGRGITVCERWRSSFEAFLSDMGPKPSRQHSIDRIDNDRGYEPGNCRWANDREQQRNKRSNHRITAFGETKTIAEWAEDPRCRATAFAIKDRLRSLGWEAEAAITTPLADSIRRDDVPAFGESKSVAEWARDPRCRVAYFTLYLRIVKKGWDPETAIVRPSRKRQGREADATRSHR